MGNSIEENMGIVLSALYEIPRDKSGYARTNGVTIQEKTGLSAVEINDAATVLVEYNYANWLQHSGTAPFIFGDIYITPTGRLELENAKRQSNLSNNSPTRVTTPISPIGSPYGFHDEDWEILSARKNDFDRLFVVIGYQFESTKYNSKLLVRNVENFFNIAVNSYNKKPDSIKVTLDFKSLAAGYGEHLFNEIARDIISSDIAVFDTSDLNPNVMLEMGVALTWGVRVLPIKRNDCPKPPTDISGQTWIDYKENGSEFMDHEFQNKLVRMVERAARKKGRNR